MPKKPKKHYHSQEESNWLRSFTIQVQKRDELASKDINWDTVHYMFASGKLTPEAAAHLYAQAWHDVRKKVSNA